MATCSVIFFLDSNFSQNFSFDCHVRSPVPFFCLQGSESTQNSESIANTLEHKINHHKHTHTVCTLSSESWSMYACLVKSFVLPSGVSIEK